MSNLTSYNDILPNTIKQIVYILEQVFPFLNELIIEDKVGDLNIVQCNIQPQFLRLLSFKILSESSASSRDFIGHILSLILIG